MTARELSVTGIVLAAGIAGLLLMKLTQSGGTTAVIEVSGSEVMRVDLDSPARTFTIPEADGVTFELSDGAIAVTESDCHDKTCVRCGYIDSEGSTIICLPKKLCVRIEGGESSADIVIG